MISWEFLWRIVGFMKCVDVAESGDIEKVPIADMGVPATVERVPRLKSSTQFSISAMFSAPSGIVECLCFVSYEGLEALSASSSARSSYSFSCLRSSLT